MKKTVLLVLMLLTGVVCLVSGYAAALVFIIILRDKWESVLLIVGSPVICGVAATPSTTSGSASGVKGGDP